MPLPPDEPPPAGAEPEPPLEAPPPVEPLPEVPPPLLSLFVVDDVEVEVESDELEPFELLLPE